MRAQRRTEAPPAAPMTDEEFWLTMARHHLAIAQAIRKRYNIGSNEEEAPAGPRRQRYLGTTE